MRRAASRPLVFVLVALAAGRAWGRSPEPAKPDPDQFPDSFRAGWAWRANPTLPTGHPTDVAVRQDGAVAVVEDDGSVWVSKDGSQWRRVLSPSRMFGAGSPDEDLLLGVEARIGEIVEEGPPLDLDEDAPEEDIEDAVSRARSEIEDTLRDAADEIRADLTSDPLLQDVSGEPRVQLLPRIWFLDETLVVGRVDGTYASEDLGEIWEPALDVQVTAIVRGPSGWVVGTVDGVRVGGEPTTWSSLPNLLPGLVVRDAAADDRGVHLASEEGLWHSVDGRRWLGEGVVDEQVLAVLPDVDTDRMWMATSTRVENGADGGRRLLPAPETSPSGVASMVRVGPDHLLTAGRTGVWETIDGGETWSPLGRGLFSRNAHALVVAGDTVWLAAEGGLFRMSADEGDVPELSLVPWVDVETLVGVAMARKGVRPEPIGRRAVAALAPRLIVEGRFVGQGDLSYNANVEVDYDIYDGEVEDVTEGGGTTWGEDGDWQILARLEWTPRKRSNAGAVEATIVGDDLVFDVTEAGVGPRLDRLGADYGIDLSRTVSELYYQRQALASERAAVRDRPVLEQVVHELRIAEIEARLDALTDGAVTAWETQGEGG
jgi:hypothetical protein